MSEEYTLVLKLLQEVRDSQGCIEDKLEVHSRQLQGHIESSNNRHGEIIKAFPGGDVDGHRRYHESIIEWAELRNKMVREALIKCAGAGAVAGAGYLLIAIYIALKMYFQQKGVTPP